MVVTWWIVAFSGSVTYNKVFTFYNAYITKSNNITVMTAVPVLKYQSTPHKECGTTISVCSISLLVT